MSRFEEKGSNIQYSCLTVEECNCEKDISCYACCHSPRALHSNCNSCHIKLAHDYMIEKFAKGGVV